MNHEMQKKQKSVCFYKVGLFALLGGVCILALYLLIFVLNPVIYRKLGPEGPEALKNIQFILLVGSILVFGSGVLSMIIGLVLGEDVKRSWLVFIFAAPTFFIMSIIVFIPLIQGISFSFTDASQSNMSKIKPVVVTKMINGKPTRVKDFEIVPATFNYVNLENYIEIFTGKRKKVRDEFRIKKKEVNFLIESLIAEELSNGNKKIIVNDLLFFSPELFEEELISKFHYVKGESLLLDNKDGLVRIDNFSDGHNIHYEFEILKGINWKVFIKKVYLPSYKRPLIYTVLIRTFVWTIVNVFFQFSIGLLLALVLNQKIRFGAGYRLLLLLPWGVPSVVSAFSWRWLFNGEFGLINAIIVSLGGNSVNWLSDPKLMLVAAIVANIWIGIPFNLVTILGGLQTIPKELYEAAKVDGANPLQQFYHVTMPMLKPVAMTVTLLGIIWTFNSFNIIYLVTGGSVDADILVTYAFRAAFRDWKMGISTAYSVIILILLMIFTSGYVRILKSQKEL